MLYAKYMKKTKVLSLLLVAAMTVSTVATSSVSADAAKKPALNKKNANVYVGKTLKLKVNNGKKKAKVTWKTSKKSVAKITKKTTVGNKATATIKGLKKGKATITATYKLGKKSTKLTCKVTVKTDDTPAPTDSVVPTQVPATQIPVVSKAPTASPVVTDPATTADPTAVPTKKPTATPRPTATPSPTPNPATQPPEEVVKPWPENAAAYEFDVTTATTNGSSIAINDDGSITATFAGSYPDISIKFPEELYGDATKYRYLEIIYSNSNGDRGLSIYDKDINWNEPWNSGETTKYDMGPTYLPEYSGTCVKVVDLYELEDWTEYLTRIDIYAPTLDRKSVV